MRARIRHLAFLTDSPDELAAFYRRELQLDELHRSPAGDISLTDGYYNLGFIKRRPELNESRTLLGLHHIGVEVDGAEEAEEVKARYQALPQQFPVIEERLGDGYFGDFRIFDPEGLAVSVSSTGFGVGPGVDRLPRVRHIAYNALWPEGVLNFFTLVFGFRELPTSMQRRKQGRGNRFCGDGWTNLAIHPFYSDVEGHEPHYGVNHFGFLVPDVASAVERLSAEITVAKRPATRPYAEYRLVDPQGNKFDLSQTKGWEVDVNKWARAS